MSPILERQYWVYKYLLYGIFGVSLEQNKEAKYKFQINVIK